MADRSGNITRGFTQVDQTSDPRFFIHFLDARKTTESERAVKELIKLIRPQASAKVGPIAPRAFSERYLNVRIIRLFGGC
jgi:hypothetical protein